MKKSKKGFTLIELMIVVAIIGILAAVAIPRFANLVDKAREAATKGGLGALRSAITIYYGRSEGVFPDSLTQPYFMGTGTQCAIEEIPPITLRRNIDTNHSASKTDIDADGINDTVAWNYTTGVGKVLVDCTHLDIVGSTYVHTW